jgi:hypothetical protein
MIHGLEDSGFKQQCAKCKAFNAHSLSYGSVKLRGHGALQDGYTLIVSVDRGPAVTVVFSSSDFINISAYTQQELINKLNASLPGTTSVADGYGVLLQSNTEGVTSCITIAGGTSAQTFRVQGSEAYPKDYTPVMLGLHIPNGPSDPHIIVLRGCGCNTYETLVVNFDTAKDDGSIGYNHRKAVNTLAMYLIENGLVTPHWAEYYQTMPTPPDIFQSLDDIVGLLP